MKRGFQSNKIAVCYACKGIRYEVTRPTNTSQGERKLAARQKETYLNSYPNPNPTKNRKVVRPNE